MAVRDFDYLSSLPVEYLPDLETLMFFNPQQRRVRSALIHTMEQHGPPRICVDGESIRVAVEAWPDVQNLFALAAGDHGYELGGFVLYVRPDLKNLLILHIAVAERFSGNGPDADSLLTVRLIDAVRGAARRLRGVCAIRVLYDEKNHVAIPVRPAAADIRSPRTILEPQGGR